MSFRLRLLTVVVTVAVVPLLLLGLWLTGQTARSGEALLAERLEVTLARSAGVVERRWIRYRSALLDVADGQDLSRALRGSGAPRSRTSLAGRPGSLDRAVETVRVLDPAKLEVWSFVRSDPPAPGLFGRPLTLSLPLHAGGGRRIGTLEAGVQFSALLGPSSELAVPGGVLTARDPSTGTILLPVPFDPILVGESRFRWNDREWISRTREVAEPRVTLVAAAPLAPFVGPFEEAARRGLWILAAVGGLGLLATVVLTGHLTASLERLAEGARAVAGGDLNRTLDVRTDDEIGQVTRAFNTMIGSLRGTLRQLADRESLAAVNEFAASLAHEIRNPLTSVQLDLQQVEEELAADSPLRRIQSEAIDELRRLDRTVADALKTARSGRIEPRSFDLVPPAQAALRRARPRVEGKGARLRGLEGRSPVPVFGDPDALEQVMLNLLLNAADAVAEGGEVSLRVESGDDEVRVVVQDDGQGITDEDRERIFEPFFTTRSGGTGLGLAVARRIVAAHRGSIDVRSAPGSGTTVTVTVSRAERAPAVD
ncbi:MAG: HAMP domain-containing sensor histidine kinase [Gemmatimonadota bacterium]